MTSTPRIEVRGSGLALVELTDSTFDAMRKRLEKPGIFCPPTIENVKNKLNYHWGLIAGKILGNKGDFVDHVINTSLPSFITPFFNHEFDDVKTNNEEMLKEQFNYKGEPKIGFKYDGEFFTDFDSIFQAIEITPEDLKRNHIDVGNQIVTRRRLDIAERYVLNKLKKDTQNPAYLGLGFCFTKVVPTFYLYKSPNEKKFDDMTSHIEYFIETPQTLLPKRA